MTDIRITTRDGARSAALGDGGVTAGRAPECELRLDDAGTSRRHCRFERRDMTVMELQLYNLRHVQHHAAQLQLLLRQADHEPPRWVGRAGRQ